MELIRDTSGLPEGLRVYGNAVITSVSPAGRNRERTGDEETGAVWFLGQRGDLHQPTGGPATGTTHTHCKKTKKNTVLKQTMWENQAGPDAGKGPLRTVSLLVADGQTESKDHIGCSSQ